MKKVTPSNTPTIFSVYAEDKKGLTGQLMMLFNRPSYNVHSINIARTDISDIILITIEADVPDGLILPFVNRLKKVVEVYDVVASQTELKKIGFYNLSVAILKQNMWPLMDKFGATVCHINDDNLVISKTGCDKDLLELYGMLEGPYLISFCKSGLINENAFIQMGSNLSF
ncbi:MAG: hypothetical protein JKY70_11470 [Mucilaginibacter sp.]|nr:hypothetical protein [Mucilaginibacter sp.]